MFSKYELNFIVKARDEETNVTQTYHEWGLGWGEGEDNGQFFEHFRSFWGKIAILMPAF